MGISPIYVHIQLAPQGISQQRLTQYTIPSVLNLESPFSYYLSSDYHVKYTLVADTGHRIPTCLYVPPIRPVQVAEVMTLPQEVILIPEVLEETEELNEEL